MLKAKIHRAVVTEANLHYEGSISIDTALCQAAGMLPFERVDVYNCTNGERFSTYVIDGKPGEICINGAAARLVQAGDVVIIACYASFSETEALTHKPTLLFVSEQNAIIRQH
jgi:aspartate 1-decarboxylase